MFDWGSKIRHCVYPFLSRVLSAGKVTMVSEVRETLIFLYLFEPKGSLPKPLPNPKLEEKLKPGKLANGSLGLIRPWLRFRLPGFSKKKVWNWISYVNSIKHASYKRLLHFMQFHSVTANKNHCIYFKHGLVDI